jgi:hypothetical protein
MEPARQELAHAMGSSIRQAKAAGIEGVESLLPIVREALEKANANVQRQVDRNIFIAERAPSE